MGQSPEPPSWPYGAGRPGPYATGTQGAGLGWSDQQYQQYPGYPGWQPPPPPPPPRRSGGSGFLIVVFVIIFAALAFVVGRTLLHPASNTTGQTTVSSGPVGDTNTQPSGRRPGVVDVDTILGFRNAQAAGTGIVLNSTGLILTNNHVIAGATTIRVTDTDNHRTYKARVVGYAKANDVAVLKLLNAGGLKTAALGDSSKAAQGDVVTAVGNAGGKGGDPTVVSGSITGLNQSIIARDESDGTSENLKGLIQTSAPIQPGDSGGPLLNTKGQVIGMDTAASAGFQFQNNGSQQQARGFAIPINQAMPIARQIQAGTASSTVHIGKTALLGVQVKAGQGGATVSGLLPGTPAESSGILPGSKITALDGAKVASPTGLTDLLLRHHPGDTIRLTYTNPNGVQQTSGIRLADGPPQ